jgi:hypothetical protein
MLELAGEDGNGVRVYNDVDTCLAACEDYLLDTHLFNDGNDADRDSDTTPTEGFFRALHEIGHTHRSCC